MRARCASDVPSVESRMSRSVVLRPPLRRARVVTSMLCVTDSSARS